MFRIVLCEHISTVLIFEPHLNFVYFTSKERAFLVISEILAKKQAYLGMMWSLCLENLE